MVLVHGFGGNADHWRKNIGPLSAHGRVFAIDLLGFGFSSKPEPDRTDPGQLYNFPTWGAQLADFVTDPSVGVGGSAFLLTNSVGGLAALCAAVDFPDAVRGVALINVSLRGLHVSKQPPAARPLIAAFQVRTPRTAGLTGGPGFPSRPPPRAAQPPNPPPPNHEL